VETSSSTIKLTAQQTWKKDTNQRRKDQRKRKEKEEKTIFLSEKMFNSFIETKKLKTKNNDKR